MPTAVIDSHSDTYEATISAGKKRKYPELGKAIKKTAPRRVQSMLCGIAEEESDQEEGGDFVVVQDVAIETIPRDQAQEPKTKVRRFGWLPVKSDKVDGDSRSLHAKKSYFPNFSTRKSFDALSRLF